MRQIFTILIAALTFSMTATANDFAAVVGARTNSWDYSSTGTGTSASGKTGLQAGVLGFIDIATALQFRSGFLYTQRNLTLTTGASETELNATYFDIPLTAMYRFSEYGGVFGGLVLALNSGKSCSGVCGTGATDGLKSSLTGIQFGASFKFAPQMGAELYYEMISGDIQTFSGGAAGKDAKSVVANLLITFE